LPEGTVCIASRDYANDLTIELSCDFEKVVRKAASDASIEEEDLKVLLATTTASEAVSRAKELAKELKDKGDVTRAKVLGTFPSALEAYSVLTGTDRPNFVEHLPCSPRCPSATVADPRRRSRWYNGLGGLDGE
jgi:hypothetical protein